MSVSLDLVAKVLFHLIFKIILSKFNWSMFEGLEPFNRPPLLRYRGLVCTDGRNTKSSTVLLVAVKC